MAAIIMSPSCSAPAVRVFLPREARKAGWIFVLLFELLVSFFLLS